MSCNSTGLLQPSGLAHKALLHSVKLSSSSLLITRWANAELRIAELLALIQPNALSELRRKAVADYVSGLIHNCLGCEVFGFGSVPLKTYLPDGDIDLTAFSQYQELRDTWASKVQTVLEYEEQRKDAECRVTKVQCINAEVKIVKCVVDDVVVDISFNQLGGLCTLCFLEEVDRPIQKDHLFKRSVLLVKAWCYYDSRILGAHHGLLSTYALETLVLYIFNVFHSTLRGPLEVLFTFLDYFSKFDWERYCVSLWGPVPLASLPDFTAEPPLEGGGKLLLSKGFLDSCTARYDVFPKGQDTQSRAFSGKFLNIVDPLRTNNNLGRSVSQANYNRIRSALHLGVRRLAECFEAIDNDFPKSLDDFFSNTWERHQNCCRPDAPTSNFPPRQMFVYKAGILDTFSSSNPANCAPETYDFGKSQKLGCLSGDISGFLPAINGCLDPQATSLCDLPSYTTSTGSLLKTSSLRASSMASKQRSEFQASLKEIMSERRVEKNLFADVVKACGRIPGDVQDPGVRQMTAEENDSRVVWKSACGPSEDQQGEGLRSSSDGFSMKRRDSNRSQLTSDSRESAKYSVASSCTTNGMPPLCSASMVQSMIVIPQKPPDFLFPESWDLLSAPPHSRSSLPPPYSSTSASSVLAPFPVVDPISSPDLDIGETNTAQVHTRVASVRLPETPILIPSHVAAPPPPPPPDKGIQGMDRSTPLLNGSSTSPTHIKRHSNKWVEQQLPGVMPALASEYKTNVCSHFPDPAAKRISRSSDSNGHSLPGHASHSCQPVLPSEATMPALGMEKHPVLDAVHSPGVYLESSGSLVRDGDNHGTPTLYSPTGAFPTVSYYNPFYSEYLTSYNPQNCRGNNSVLPISQEFQDFRGNCSGSWFAHEDKSRSVSTFSAESCGMEPLKDLLRSDLANHLRHLEFGRWCQDPVLQPALESPVLYYSPQGPSLWGVSPFTPLPGIVIPFDHVKGPILSALPPQNFVGVPQNLQWPGATEVGDVHTQRMEAGTFLPFLRDADMYRDTKSLGPQTVAQFDQGLYKEEKTGDMNAANQVCTLINSCETSASVVHNGVRGADALGSSITAHGVPSTSLLNQLPGRVFPLVAGQLEFGSLGPVEIMSFPDNGVSTTRHHNSVRHRT